MKTVIQRVTRASVTIDGEVHGRIGNGFLVLAGICDQDGEAQVEKMAAKIAGMRIFEDEAGKMNLSLAQTGRLLTKPGNRITQKRCIFILMKRSDPAESTWKRASSGRI